MEYLKTLEIKLNDLHKQFQKTKDKNISKQIEKTHRDYKRQLMLFCDPSGALPKGLSWKI